MKLHCDVVLDSQWRTKKKKKKLNRNIQLKSRCLPPVQKKKLYSNYIEHKEQIKNFSIPPFNYN